MRTSRFTTAHSVAPAHRQLWRCGICAAFLLSSPAPMLRAQSPAQSCTLEKGTYRCDWQIFRARFDGARTVSIEAQPMDRSTETQLRHLVQSLGKSVALPGQTGDITFRVVPANTGGFAIGPSDQPLASLQVFTRAPEGGHATLLWVETFTGQADRPYPMVVTALTDQFQERFRRHGH